MNSQTQAVTSPQESTPNRAARRAARKQGQTGRKVATLGLSALMALGTVGLGSTGAEAAGYPYPDAPDCTEVGSNAGCIADKWKFFQGQCTSWVAWKLNSVNGVGFHNYYKGVHWGGAGNWDNAARAAGIRVDSKPARGAVAQWNGRYHVAYVEKVNSDGSIVISEMNYDLHNGTRTLTIRPGSTYWPDNFIHIKDLTTTTATSYKGKIVRNRDTGAAYLVKTDGRRYHIPSGGDYQAIANNGVRVVNLSPAQIQAIPNSGKTATVKRQDEPSITGPSRWMTRRTNTPYGYGRDYWITTSAAGKSYTTNAAEWKITGRTAGVYRVKVYVPKREAVANVKYKVFDGNRYLKTITINQRDHYGWASLGDHRITSGTIRIVQPDNWGSGPYNSIIGWDAAEAVPIR